MTLTNKRLRRKNYNNVYPIQLPYQLQMGYWKSENSSVLIRHLYPEFHNSHSLCDTSPPQSTNIVLNAHMMKLHLLAICDSVAELRKLCFGPNSSLLDKVKYRFKLQSQASQQVSCVMGENTLQR